MFIEEIPHNTRTRTRMSTNTGFTIETNNCLDSMYVNRTFNHW